MSIFFSFTIYPVDSSSLHLPTVVARDRSSFLQMDPNSYIPNMLRFITFIVLTTRRPYHRWLNGIKRNFVEDFHPEFREWKIVNVRPFDCREVSCSSGPDDQ